MQRVKVRVKKGLHAQTHKVFSPRGQREEMKYLKLLRESPEPLVSLFIVHSSLYYIRIYSGLGDLARKLT